MHPAHVCRGGGGGGGGSGGRERESFLFKMVNVAGLFQIYNTAIFILHWKTESPAKERYQNIRSLGLLIPSQRVCGSVVIAILNVRKHFIVLNSLPHFFLKFDKYC